MDAEHFVGIDNPMDVRRNILESSREIIQTLQKFDKLKEIREEKLKTLHQLRTVIRELNLLFSKLKAELPSTHLRALAPEEVSLPSLKDAPKIEKSELEELESQLMDIERELTRLS
ncbi:hypothetical protein JW930_06415 [Candidatus Woesearchaeota archaeon]|nr:hypothetical protein [Candidatus Woesearchaeota archaeon]